MLAGGIGAMAEFSTGGLVGVTVGIEGGVYERKVVLPQSGSPRRRMVTVGGLSMDGFRALEKIPSDVGSALRPLRLARAA